MDLSGIPIVAFSNAVRRVGDGLAAARPGGPPPVEPLIVPT